MSGKDASMSAKHATMSVLPASTSARDAPMTSKAEFMSARDAPMSAKENFRAAHKRTVKFSKNLGRHMDAPKISEPLISAAVKFSKNFGPPHGRAQNLQDASINDPRFDHKQLSLPSTHYTQPASPWDRLRAKALRDLEI